VIQGVLTSAGERLGIECAIPWVGELIREASDGCLTGGDPDTSRIRIRVEQHRDAFHTGGWEPLARGVAGRDGSMVLRNLLSTGFDLRVDPSADGGTVAFTFRWRPPRRERAMALAMRSRFHLLARSALLRYPALWWAGTRGRAPLHAAVCTAGEGRTVLLAGPGAVGESTLTSMELASGGSAICDNLCVSDGVTAWGVVEPQRLEGGGGRRVPHGRAERSIPNRIASMVPQRGVVLRRGSDEAGSVATCRPVVAERSLVAGTYMARELRRYWAFAATLALGTGIGPAHPPVAQVASTLATELPAVMVTLPDRPGRGWPSSSTPWSRRPRRGNEGAATDRPPLGPRVFLRPTMTSSSVNHAWP
jgi:hypothetical protein